MRKFIKDNVLIFWIGVASTLISVSYAVTYYMPDCYGIESWYSLLNSLSISYLAALVFYVIQVYIPQCTQNRQAYACIRIRIDDIVRHMKEVFDELGNRYVKDYSKRDITDELLLDILHQINLDDRVHILNCKRLFNSNVNDESHYTVKEWIVSRMEFVEHEIDCVFKYYPSYVTPDLMKTMEEILHSFMHQNFGRSLSQMPCGISFSSCNQDILLKPYYDLMKDLENEKIKYST